MLIRVDGKDYTDTEIVAYIKELKEENAKLKNLLLKIYRKYDCCDCNHALCSVCEYKHCRCDYGSMYKWEFADEFKRILKGGVNK